MNEHPSFVRWVEAALAELDYALKHDNVGRVINALSDIGRAEVALGSGSLVSAAEAAPQRDALRSRAAGHSDLFARAAAFLDRPMRWRWDDGGLVESLFARTGYQVLLDMGIWPEPPLDDFHLGEVDEELADGVTREPPEVPDGAPASHRWWWPPEDD